MSLKCDTGKTFSDTTEKIKLLLNPDYYNFVMNHKDKLDAMIIEDRDMSLDWFGICTAIKSYLVKINNVTIETPQHLFLRVATWIWMNHSEGVISEGVISEGVISERDTNFEKIHEVYDDLSLHNYMHATPTLFNSGLRRPQLSSCYLMKIDDNMDSISKSWHDCAMISKNSGGIGIDISDIRHSMIGNSGASSGIVPMLRVHNDIVNYVDQNGRRKGSAAIYLPDYHIDIFEFLELRKNSGSEKMRARDLFYALWLSDLFMNRVQKDEMWSLFCPNEARGLNDTWGKDFEQLYLKYEREELYIKQVRARELWQAIYIAQVETGQPYILFKDTVNRKSNQQNLGTIRCSNLCCEICQYTSKNEIASCNLANIVLNSCVKNVVSMKQPKNIFDFSKLERLSRALVRNLNRVVDINYYLPEVPEIKNSNLKHRPLGIGVQGLADTFALMDYSWDSLEAKELNMQIFETIYYGAITESMKISYERKIKKEQGINRLKSEWKKAIDLYSGEKLTDEHLRIRNELEKYENMYTTYQSFEGSPASKGFLQFDLWNAEKLQKDGSVEHNNIDYVVDNSNYDFCSGRYNWNRVRNDLQRIGLYNSLLIAIMPTASTAHLIGNNECIEPFTNMIYSRTVLSGQFMLVNKHMVNDFQNLGIWCKDLSNDIIQNNGSIQTLDFVNYLEEPTEKQLERFEFLKKKYMTVFELSQETTASLAIDRGRFICQSQSFNCFMKNPSYQKMCSFLFYQWMNGAKTGMYYLRSNPSANAIKMVIDVDTLKKRDHSEKEIVKQEGTSFGERCTDEVCVMCQ